MSLPKLSIGRPVAVAMFFVAIVFLGAISFTRLAVDLLPDIAYPKLVVYTTNAEVAPGRSSASSRSRSSRRCRVCPAWSGSRA
jgi:multidrug efflux pump subunit AcrB